MKRITVPHLLICAAALFLLNACQSAAECNTGKDCAMGSTQTLKNADSYLALSADRPAGLQNLQPGNVYLSPGLADEFKLLRPVTLEINEEGLLCARVFGKTKAYSFLKWMLFGEAPRRIAYRFVWFDSNGKPTGLMSITQVRGTLPGDPVRFTEIAPCESCRNLSFIAGFADDLPQASELVKTGGSMDGQDRPEPAEKVKTAEKPAPAVCPAVQRKP